MEIVDEHRDDLRITIVYFRKGKSGVWNRWKALRAGISHIQSRGEWNFDLLHHNVMWNEGWQAVVIRKRFRLPVVMTEHWTGYLRDQRGKIPKRIVLFSQWVARYVSVFAPVTDHLGKNMKQYGIKGRYQTVPNVVDTGLFSAGSKSSETIHFLHVSSLNDAHKNISGILRAWKVAVQSSSVPIHLNLGGDGPWEKYRDLAIELGLSAETISFFGEKTWEEIADMMHVSHVLLLFSNYENLPCVIVESLASGMRILSSSVGGISEHIDTFKGELVDAGDEAALSAAILREADQASQVDRASLVNYADVHFGKPAIARSFDHIYQSLLKNQRPQ